MKPLLATLVFFGLSLLVPQSAFAAPIVPGSFSTTWDTSTRGSDGESNNNQISFSLGGGDGDVCTGVLYWEEIGNDSNNGTSTLDSNCNTETITFPAEGNYRVDISGTFPTFRGVGDAHKLLTVEQWGDDVWSRFQNSFANAVNMNITASDAPNLSVVTSLHGMFERAESLNASIDHWDVSHITDMSRMFFNAYDFNQPLNNWDVSNVTDMSWMFHESAFNQPLNNWDVSSVTNFHAMFHRAAAFNQDISNWDVSSATSLDGMFSVATAFDQNLSSWNISQVATINGIFDDTSLSPENYSSTLVGWASLPTLQSDIYLSASGRNYLETASTARQFLIDTYNWTIDDGGLFIEPSNARFITRWDTTLAAPTNHVKFDISGSGANFYIDWGDGNIDYYSAAPDTITYTYATPGVKTITFIGEVPQFYFCYGDPEADKIIDVIQWGTNVWQNFDYAFQDCTHLEGFSATDTPNLSQVTDLYALFQRATVFNQDISNWNVSNVNNMGYMFDGATAFNQDLSAWDITNVSDIYYAFRGTALSTPNYTKMLLAWSQLTLQDSAGLGTVGGTYDPDLDDYINLTPYCSLAQSARDIMTGTYNWTMTDGGPVPCQTATYTAGDGGTLTGDTFQYIPDGQSGTAVTAVPAEGYRFVSWSDGSTANPRTDGNLTSSLSVTATFEATGDTGDATKVGVRAERLVELAKSAPVVGSMISFISSVRDFLSLLTEHEDVIDSLTAEERTKVIVALRDILLFLLQRIPGF